MTGGDTDLVECLTVAAKFADEVDRCGRFPAETIEALQAAGLISPAPGDGHTICPIEDMCRTVRAISAACGSTGMIVGMHYTQLSALARYSTGNQYLQELFADVVDRQALIASSTTEVSTGGDTGRSSCAVVPNADGTVRLRKEAGVISYATRAAVVLVTARRAEDAEPSDQVLVACAKGDLHLAKTSGWDAIGMRGTDSNGYLLTADLPGDAVLGTPYGTILAEDMAAVTHVMWCSVWLGIADTIISKVRAKLARERRGAAAVADARFYEMLARRQTVESVCTSVLADRERSPGSAPSFTARLRTNGLKTIASDGLVDIAVTGLGILGMAGYVNDSPFSVGRPLRDALSAPLMVGNDRIRANSAELALIAGRTPRSVT